MNAPITKGSIFVDRHGQEWCVQEVLGFGRYTCRKTDSPHYFFGLDEWTGRQIRAAQKENDS